MAKLTVSVAGVDYDRTRALFDGTVAIAGCETICCAMSPEEAFHRAFRYQEFDITDLSLSNSMALIAKGANAYTAIPVVPFRPLPAGDTLAQHLDDGRIDGVISALAPSCFGRNPAVRRLFPDYRAAEEAYFERTRIFPIMHVVGIRRSLLERHPWLAVNTYIAYQKAKEICYRRLETIGHLFTTLPWPVEELKIGRAHV